MLGIRGISKKGKWWQVEQVYSHPFLSMDCFELYKTKHNIVSFENSCQQPTHRLL